MKKCLFIINNYIIDSISTLKNFNINYIKSNKLIDKTENELREIIEEYDIIIIGGGPQHLIKGKIDKYPEIRNLLKIIEISEIENKLLIGICLGCQLIGLYYNCKIIELDNLCIGCNNFDLNSINNKFYQDKYLKNIDIKMLKNVFSFHYDAIDIKEIENIENIEILGYSKNNNPYIIKHKNKPIYGFQFHPEICFNTLEMLKEFYNVDINLENITDCSDILKIFIL
jgi:anthranilate/para-aminobenzoate synthase component II